MKISGEQQICIDSVTDLVCISLHSLPEVIFNATFSSSIIWSIFSKNSKERSSLGVRGPRCEWASFFWCSKYCADPMNPPFWWWLLTCEVWIIITYGCSEELGEVKVPPTLSENPYTDPNNLCGLHKPICSSSGYHTQEEKENMVDRSVHCGGYWSQVWRLAVIWLGTKGKQGKKFLPGLLLKSQMSNLNCKTIEWS